MKRIVLSTSSSGLDNLKVPHNIELIRLRLFINNVEFIDGKNLTLDRLYHIMYEVGFESVATAPAPKAEVIQIFQDLVDRGYEEVFITTLSSLMSQSHQIIKEVAAEFIGKLNIHVYDCKELNICEGILALEAEHLIKQGKSLPDVAMHLDRLRASHSIRFAVDDLSYLIKNKRLSAPAGFFANMLSIKPVLHVNDAGAIVPIKKIRKFEKALDYIIDDIGDSVKNASSFPYVLTAGRTEIDQHFVQLLKQRLGINSIPVLPVSSVSLINHGPTGVGLCVFDRERPAAAEFYQNV